MYGNVYVWKLWKLGEVWDKYDAVYGHPVLGIILGVGLANGGRHYVAPIGWSHNQNDPCRPYITVQNFIIVLHIIVISDPDSISKC